MAGKPDVPLTMDAFSPANQPDEGYSEDPLNPPPRNAVLTSLATMRSPADLPTWLASNIAALPLSVRTGKAFLPLSGNPQETQVLTGPCRTDFGFTRRTSDFYDCWDCSATQSTTIYRLYASFTGGNLP